MEKKASIIRIGFEDLPMVLHQILWRFNITDILLFKILFEIKKGGILLSHLKMFLISCFYGMATNSKS